MSAPSFVHLDKAVDVCVEECGAKSDDFFGIAAHRKSLTEWRFQGDLGFGGKLRWDDHDGRFRVTCYREDETQERAAMMGRANARLRELADAL